MDPIGYTYDAAIHCPNCAMEHVGECKKHRQIACCCVDSEGNEPHAIFQWDELEDGNQYCDDCGDEIGPVSIIRSDQPLDGLTLIY